jgi:hypothetical protein
MSIEKIITRLAKAVQLLPLDTMVARVWLPGEPEITQSVQELEAGARDAITRLSLLAGAGQDDAAVALRDIGNHAALELESLMPSESLEGGRRRSSIETGPFHASAVFSRPVVEILGDLSSVIEVLKSSEQAIEKISPEDLAEQIKNRRIAGRGRFSVNALAALGYPKEVLDEHRRRTSKESVHYDHPQPILEWQLAKTKTAKGETDPTKQREAVRLILISLTQHLMEIRLEELCRTKAGQLPSGSLEWPVCVSAFRRDTQERVDSLHVGRSLPFVPSGIDNKTGRPPSVEHGSAIHFALEYCTALEAVRSMHLRSTEEERADWRKTIEGIENAIKHGVGGNPDKKLLAHPTRTTSSDPYHGVSLCILWTYKAAILPEFPSSRRLGDDEAKADLEFWLDAAMARARMICWNNWEGFVGWPRCVRDRRQSNKRGRSAQSVVRQKLQEGMLQLKSVSSMLR